MARRGGKRASQAEVAARERKIALALESGARRTDLALALGVSRVTVWRSFRRLRDKFNLENASKFEAARAKQLAELEELRRIVSSDPALRDSEKVELQLAIHDREVRITGTAAPQVIGMAIKAEQDSAPVEHVVTFVDPPPQALSPAELPDAMLPPRREPPQLAAGDGPKEEEEWWRQ